MMMMANFHIHEMQPMCAYMYTVNNQENYSCWRHYLKFATLSNDLVSLCYTFILHSD